MNYLLYSIKSEQITLDDLVKRLSKLTSYQHYKRIIESREYNDQDLDGIINLVNAKGEFEIVRTGNTITIKQKGV